MSDNIIQPMPELLPEQLDALRADIAANGITVPVVKDQHGRILDGNTRVAIAAELGIDYPTVTVTVADDSDAWDRAVALNCSRRHMSRAQVRGVIVGEILRRPSDSDRAIAKRVGCSPSTVGTVRAKVSNLDSLAGEFEEAADAMRIQSCLRMVPLLFHPKVTTAQVQAAWQTGMANLDANEYLGMNAAAWVRHKVFQPLADYLAGEGAVDKERVRQHADRSEVYPETELPQRLDGLTDWLPMMGVVLREFWPEVFTDTDAWVADRLLSNLDAEAVTK